MGRSQKRSADFFDFTAASGTYTLTAVDDVLLGEPLFVSVNDSRLQAGAAAIDSGVDPSTVDSSLSAGTSVDGVSRAGREIDRGAYEQGN